MNNIAGLKQSLTDLPAREPIAGVLARKLAGEHVMLQYVTVKKGVSAPQHQHPNEQMMVLIEGRMRMQVGDATKGELTELEMKPGEIIHYPPNMLHGGEALEDSVILDIFSPPSETTGIDNSSG
jgi:quercetin dioxygenase-like cupin family protein